MKRLFFILLCLGLPATLFADTVHLKNGKSIRVEKTWEADGQIKCRLLGAVIGYAKEDVIRVVKDDYTPPPEPGQKTISPDFHETDIRKVIGIIREVSGKNIAVDPDVTGEVTLTVDHPVPWEEVLDVALKMNHLAKEYFGENTIRIYTVKSP